MKKILCVLIALTFLTGCALTTIRPPKKRAAVAPKPERRPIIERVREVIIPKPAPAEKEEVLPVKPKEKEKEEVLPEEEDIK